MTILLDKDFSGLPDGTTLDTIFDGVQYCSKNDDESAPSIVVIDNGRLVNQPWSHINYAYFPYADVGKPNRRMKFRTQMGTTVPIGSILDGFRLSTVFLNIFWHGAKSIELQTFGMAYDTNPDIYSRGQAGYPEHDLNISNYCNFSFANDTDASSELTVEIRLFDDNTFSVFINSTLVTGFIFPDGSHCGPRPPIPSAYINSNLMVFGPNFATDENTPPPYHGIRSVNVKDDVNLVDIKSADKYRVTSTASGFRCLVETNTTATHLSAEVRLSSDGTLLATGSAAVSNGAATINTTPMDPQYAGQFVSIHVVNPDGDDSQADTYITTVPYTATMRDVRLGHNATFCEYWAIGAECRDLMRSAQLRTRESSGFVAPAWTQTNFVDGDLLGVQPNGLPTKFSDPSEANHDGDPGYTRQSFLLPEHMTDYFVGDFVLDMSDQPGLRPLLVFHPSLPTEQHEKVTLDLDYYDVGKHRLTFHALFPDLFDLPTDAKLIVIEVWSDSSTYADPASLPAGGWQMTCKKFGDADSNKFLSPELQAWWAGLGPYFGQRYMTDQMANEAYGASPDWSSLTADRRVRADGLFGSMGTGNSSVGRPIEYMAQAASLCGGWLWYSIPRFTHPSYIEYCLDYLMAHYPSLEVVFEFSNELWNFGFAQGGICAFEGFRRGLGKSDAVFGQDEDLAIPPVIPSNSDGSYITPYPDEPAGTRYQAYGSIFVSNGTGDVGVNPGSDNSRYDLDQDFNVAKYRQVAEVMHELAAAMQAKAGDLYGTRYKFAIGTWQSNVGITDSALLWGPADGPKLGEIIHGVATANYFPFSSAVDMDVEHGAVRQAAILANVTASAADAITEWRSHVDYLAQLNSQHGWDLEAMCYEGGHHLTIEDKTGDPTDSWFADVQAVLNSVGFENLYHDTLVTIAEEAGGTICWFDSFGFKEGQYGVHNLYQFGISDSVYDTNTSARYRGIRRASQTLGLTAPDGSGGSEDPGDGGGGDPGDGGGGSTPSPITASLTGPMGLTVGVAATYTINTSAPVTSAKRFTPTLSGFLGTLMPSLVEIEVGHSSATFHVTAAAPGMGAVGIIAPAGIASPLPIPVTAADDGSLPTPRATTVTSYLYRRW
jgi:hypothetical protein